IGLQRLEGAGLQRLHVVVVHGGRLGEDFFLGHRGQKPRLGDSPRPFLAQLGAIVAQMRDQLPQQGDGGFRHRRIHALFAFDSSHAISSLLVEGCARPAGPRDVRHGVRRNGCPPLPAPGTWFRAWRANEGGIPNRQRPYPFLWDLSTLFGAHGPIFTRLLRSFPSEYPREREAYYGQPRSYIQGSPYIQDWSQPLPQ